RARFHLDRGPHAEDRRMSGALAIIGAAVEKDGRRLLDDISFEAAGGAFIGVIGPNGAGKSTLLRTFAGLEPLSAGHYAVDGRPLAGLAPLERARLIAFQPQARPIYWSTPAQAIVALGRFAYGAP